MSSFAFKGFNARFGVFNMSLLALSQKTLQKDVPQGHYLAGFFFLEGRTLIISLESSQLRTWSKEYPNSFIKLGFQFFSFNLNFGILILWKPQIAVFNPNFQFRILLRFEFQFLAPILGS